MKLSWTDHGWDDYLYWQTQDRKTLKRINALIADIKRDPDGPGIGKPEILRNNLAGLRSRRIGFHALSDNRLERFGIEQVSIQVGHGRVANPLEQFRTPAGQST